MKSETTAKWVTVEELRASGEKEKKWFFDGCKLNRGGIFRLPY